MLNFLNTIVLFGKEFNWPLENALFWLLIAQVALILVAVIVFAVLIKRVGTNQVTLDEKAITVESKPVERALQSISLDLSMVKRNFEVGEDFDCDGLIVCAHYNTDPACESIADFAVTSREQLDVLQKNGTAEGCYVLPPTMTAEGKLKVWVYYHDQQAVYIISVGEQAQPAAQPIAMVPVEISAPVEERALTGLSLDLGVVQREFTEGDEFNCDGIVITAEYNLDPKAELITDYTVIDKEVFDGIAEEELNGCYVIKPDVSKAGKVAVTVRYREKTAIYMVVVSERAAEEPEAEQEAEIPETPVRKLVGITLDLSLVQREFKEGDEFNCDGLIVNANFDLEPLTESVINYSVIDEEAFENLSADVEGCYVVKPDLSKAGKQIVTVRYEKLTAHYTVAVAEPEAEQEEETPEEPVRKLIGITLDLSLVQREFTEGDEFNCDGLIVNANFDLEPLTESVVNYSVIDEETAETLPEDAEGCYVITPDLSKAGKPIVTVRYQKLVAHYTVVVAEPKEEETPERTMLYITVNTDAVKKDFVEGDAFTSEGLIVIAHFNLEPLEEEIENYSIIAPDMNVPGSPNVSVQYQDRTVGYRVNIAARPVEETVVVKHERVVYDEESYEAGVLRYDKSFTARFIQSDDETKSWYTKLKNEMLSYKKVKARMSWKRETFRMGRDTVARLGYRGNTLCIFLPLDPADYVDSRFKVEDVSDSPSYVDTPCMYRLKNEKRVRLAIELFATVMEKFGGVHFDRISEDYYVPYEGIVELIDKGLAKRVIKNKADEAIFLRDASEAAADAAPAEEQPAENSEIKAEQPAETAPEATETAFEEAPAQNAENAAEQTEATPNESQNSTADSTEETEQAPAEEQQSELIEETTTEEQQLESTLETPAEDQTQSLEETPAEETHQAEENTPAEETLQAEEQPQIEEEATAEEQPQSAEETPAEEQEEQLQAEEEIPTEEQSQAEEETPAEETLQSEEQPQIEEEATAEEQSQSAEETPAEEQQPEAIEETPTEDQTQSEEEAPAADETESEQSDEESQDDPEQSEEDGEQGNDDSDDNASSSSSSSERIRWNGKNRKRHKVRR